MSKSKIISGKIIQIYKKASPKTGKEYLFLRLQGKGGERTVVLAFKMEERWGELIRQGPFYDFEIAKSQRGNLWNLLNWTPTKSKQPNITVSTKYQCKETGQTKILMNDNLKNFGNFEAKMENARKRSKFRNKPSTNTPGSLTSEVKRLVAKRFQNAQEWIKERKQKEEEQSEELKKLISEVWNKEPKDLYQKVLRGFCKPRIKDYGNN